VKRRRKRARNNPITDEQIFVGVAVLAVGGVITYYLAIKNAVATTPTT
jgi:hypothetical protein